MKVRQNLTKLTSKLTQILDGYVVSPAIGGWHLHKGNVYCGQLQYRRVKGWQGSALRHLPSELLAQLKKITQ
ncbi:MAG TPA: hypothetical protein V6C90_06585 [Coleofasciculaceae cyanobacterium]|jgi:hypothetical protein